MSSRKEQKARLREERLARERAAAEAARRKRLVTRGVGGVAAVAALGGIVAVLASGSGSGVGGGGSGDFPDGTVPPQQATELKEAARAAGCTLKDFESDGANHVEEQVTYRSKPPHSGNHSPQPADDGAYTESPGTEHVVHSLEHGRIVIWFKPTVPASVKGDLKAFFDEDSYHMVLTADETGMPLQVAASAWTHVLGCPRMNDKTFDAIRTFKDQYRDQGPEFVP